MSELLELHRDRLFPSNANCRDVARRLYEDIKNLPIISPHGHTDPKWFAKNDHFRDPYALLVAPDHYLLRMLYSQGVSKTDMGIKKIHETSAGEPRAAWRTFARHQFLFRGTPSGLWLDHVFKEIFGQSRRLQESTADDYYDSIAEQLSKDEFRPRQIFDRFNIEFLSTTESAVDSLQYHKELRDSDWDGNVVTTYRPDSVIDPEHHEFKEALLQFGELSAEDVYSWDGYLRAHRKRRADFIALGATATDHGHPSAQTANLTTSDCRKLFGRVITGSATPDDAELFRAQMLTEMARMSIDDGLVMQLHPGSFRNHNAWLFDNYGSDKGADIPARMEYTNALKPLLDEFGNHPNLTVIVFTLDESTYARELAPLAGHYPCLLLGPPWWFNDSPEGILRFREQTTETAGFYNTAGFNDDTRALFSIPARHDMSRRIDCTYLARLVCEHRLSETDAHTIANDLTNMLPRCAYRIGDKA
ncbi:MAG: glucuronate isomerase [Gammaproteobacteria bacterium]|jgi:glucuronate isomerase|nr:glucuronate isomerase [Gammaproteobacteria bacterium]